MRKINDEKIIQLVKTNTNYQVKTTSQNILNQYAYETKLEQQTKPVKKHRKAIAFGSIFGTLVVAGAAALAVLFVSNSDDSNNNSSIVFPDTNPVNNKMLKKQLITFSAFADQFEAKSLFKKRMLKAQEIDDEEENEQNDIKDLVAKSVNIYDSVEKSVNYLYNESNIKTVTSEISATFDNISYTNVTKFYYGDSKEEFASYYFNFPSEEKEKDEITRISKAYYECNDLRFDIEVKEEIEKEDDEEEIETTLILRDVNKVDKRVFVVEKEVETETENNVQSSENSLSIITYKDENSFKEENYIKKVTSETEVENNQNEIEIGVETNEYEVEYKVLKIDKDTLNLETTYEELINDERSFENELIKLEYKNNSRIYTWNTSTWEF